MDNTTTPDRADGPAAGTLSSRDWYGEAQRRIEGLSTPGVWGDNPDVPKMGTRLGRTPGIALLRQAQRSPARTRIARTLTTPEEHPALREPLKPATWLRPMLTFQSPAAASLARLEQPVGLTDGGEGGEIEAPAVRVPGARQSRIPFVRRIFRLLDPRPEPAIESRASRAQPRGIPPRPARTDLPQPAAERVVASPRSDTPESAQPEPPPLAPAASSLPVTARQPAHEDETPLEAAPPTVLRQPSNEEASPTAVPQIETRREQLTSEGSPVSTGAPLAAFVRRVFRREPLTPPEVTPPDLPRPPADAPRAVAAPSAPTPREQPPTEARGDMPSLAAKPLESSGTPAAPLEVPLPRLEVRTGGPVIERPAPESRSDATRPASPHASTVERSDDRAPTPIPPPVVARTEPAPTAIQHEAAPAPDAVPAMPQAVTAPAVEAVPAPPRVDGPESTTGPSLVRRILRRITRSPEPKLAAPVRATATRAPRTSDARPPILRGEPLSASEAATPAPISEPLLILRHETPTDAAGEASLPEASFIPSPVPTAQGMPREDGPTPLQLTPRIEAGPAAEAASRVSRIETPLTPTESVAPRPTRTAIERTPSVDVARSAELPPVAGVDLDFRESALEQRAEPPFATPAAEEGLLSEARPPEASPAPPPPAVVRRNTPAEAAPPGEVRRVFRRSAAEPSLGATESGPRTVHADALARELGFARPVARSTEAGPTPSARVASVVRRAEQPSVARHAAASPTDEDVFREARSGGGPVAILREETSEASTDAPAASEAEAAAAAPAEPDAQALDRLAQAVYTRLRRRFVVERERAGRGERWT